MKMTLKISGKTHEEVPADVIRQAALKAVDMMM